MVEGSDNKVEVLKSMKEEK